MKNSNASLFRRHAVVEDAMLRASMPRTSAGSFQPLIVDLSRRDVVAAASGTRLVRVTRQEVARVAA